ncbi:MAG: HAD-IA family hydrolase [Paludibacter sp.]|nr:HAD-IA family hydrolase [Paludibacter sp.]MDD4198286.1 HAD-IA family hydrolase [Paludibacter sp.]MDD4426978.1 HAD-IA family hydrolase [Paludibacter sp.]
MFFSEIKNFIQEKNYPEFQLKAVFFDMDGVLLDSMENHAKAWVRTMNDLSIPFTIEEAYMNEGRVGHDTINSAYMRAFGRVATVEEQESIYEIKTQHLETLGPILAMPRSTELLNKIKQQELAIYLVTGSGQPTLINSLDDYFPDIFVKDRMVTAFDVKRGKPSPEPYLKALNKSGLKPWEVVVIENAPLGVESSVAAGLFTIAVNTGPLDPEVLSANGANVVLIRGMQELFEKWDDFYACSVLVTH